MSGTPLEPQRRMNPAETWYDQAHGLCMDLANRHGLRVNQVAGILAALSQRRKWTENCKATRALLRGEDPGGLPKAKHKAEQILAGQAPHLVLRGPKITAFYRAILGDTESIVIDTWMIRYLKLSSEKLTPKQYERAAETIRLEAEARRIPPSTYQALVWAQTRGGAT